MLGQIKASSKLKDLAMIIEQLNVSFDEELIKKLEQERLILEDKVERARYGYIVSRKEYYQKLMKDMEEFSVTMT